jgi:hypothetical protein
VNILWIRESKYENVLWTCWSKHANFLWLRGSSYEKVLWICSSKHVNVLCTYWSKHVDDLLACWTKHTNVYWISGSKYEKVQWTCWLKHALSNTLSNISTEPSQTTNNIINLNLTHSLFPKEFCLVSLTLYNKN